jgi:voltage-gated potassium channel
MPATHNGDRVDIRPGHPDSIAHTMVGRREQHMFAPMRAVIRDPEGKVLLVSAATMIAVGTVVYHVLEGWSFLDSLYFSVVTLATVGYGDFHPTTDVARLFTVGYILVGIGILAAFASELTKFRKAERLGENVRLAPPPDDLSGGSPQPAAGRQDG